MHHSTQVPALTHIRAHTKPGAAARPGPSAQAPGRQLHRARGSGAAASSAASGCRRPPRGASGTSLWEAITGDPDLPARGTGPRPGLTQRPQVRWGSLPSPPPQDTHTLGMADCRPWVLWLGLVAAGAIVQVSGPAF